MRVPLRYAYGSLVFEDGTIAPIRAVELRGGRVEVAVEVPGAVARAAEGTVLRMHGEDGSLITTIECGGLNLADLDGADSVSLVLPLGFIDQHCRRPR